MKILTSSVACLAISTNILIAGGNSLTPEEPIVAIPEKEVIVVNNDVTYDGFYLGGALSYLRMNEISALSGHAVTLSGGYYFNKYIGIEARYTSTLSNIDEDKGKKTISANRKLRNMGVYLKPMFNLTTGFSAYGLAGYGKAEVDTDEESGLQWGIGAKYELANGVGLYFDYMNLYEGDDFGTIEAQDVFFNATTVGATYTF